MGKPLSHRLPSDCENQQGPNASLFSAGNSKVICDKSFKNIQAEDHGGGGCFLLKLVFFCGVEGEIFCAPINKMQSTSFLAL